ncbi:MAG: hypothetical protein IJV50_09175 [Lachnospiraceae bacterium]|nr:hypothetical protein [Lachnospiraceae bacterium]
MKGKYKIAEDGFVGYWHPADGHEGNAIIVFPGSEANYELTKKGSDFLEKALWSRLLVAFAKWDGLPEDPSGRVQGSGSLQQSSRGQYERSTCVS